MITSIELLDFLSHEDTTINLEDGVTIFVGENGAGKSSIIDAITFSLFGKHTRKSNRGLIRRGNNQGAVTIKFSIITQTQYFTPRFCLFFFFDPFVSVPTTGELKLISPPPP